MNIPKGLTLIEILVAMAILAVIASIALPAYRGYISTAHKTECQNEVAAIKLAESEYFLENNKYFKGGDAATLETISGGIYTRSKAAADAAASECVYTVITPTTTSYIITANKNPNGGHLKNETDPIVTFTGP